MDSGTGIARHVRKLMRLRSIMYRFPKTVIVTDTLVHANKVMGKDTTHPLVVVDPEEQVVGVLTDGDIARHQARIGESIWSCPTDTVDMAMSTPVHVGTPEFTIVEAASLILKEKIGCLPLLEAGSLIGIVTARDILAATVQRESLAAVSKQALVGEVMTPNPQTVAPEDLLLEGAVRMSRFGIRHLPVIDANRQVVGMLSDREVRTKVGDPAQAHSRVNEATIASLQVRDVMSQAMVTATAEQSCVEVARTLAEMRGTAVPVTDENHTLVGILSYVDLLRALTAE